jgi:hypothetical protein
MREEVIAGCISVFEVSDVLSLALRLMKRRSLETPRTGRPEAYPTRERTLKIAKV